MTAVVQPHEEALKKLTYSPVFAGLVVRYEQMNYVEEAKPEPVVQAQYVTASMAKSFQRILGRCASVATAPWSAHWRPFIAFNTVDAGC